MTIYDIQNVPWFVHRSTQPIMTQVCFDQISWNFYKTIKAKSPKLNGIVPLSLLRFCKHFWSMGRSNKLLYQKIPFFFVVFNATFNNISILSWRSVLLVEETRVPRENHRPVASHWQSLSHNVVSSTLHHERGSNSQH
jgi:hypothetical protein